MPPSPVAAGSSAAQPPVEFTIRPVRPGDPADRAAVLALLPRAPAAGAPPWHTLADLETRQRAVAEAALARAEARFADDAVAPTGPPAEPPAGDAPDRIAADEPDEVLLVAEAAGGARGGGVGVLTVDRTRRHPAPRGWADSPRRELRANSPPGSARLPDACIRRRSDVAGCRALTRAYQSRSAPPGGCVYIGP